MDKPDKVDVETTSVEPYEVEEDEEGADNRQRHARAMHDLVDEIVSDDGRIIDAILFYHRADEDGDGCSVGLTGFFHPDGHLIEGIVDFFDDKKDVLETARKDDAMVGWIDEHYLDDNDVQ